MTFNNGANVRTDPYFNPSSKLNFAKNVTYDLLTFSQQYDPTKLPKGLTRAFVVLCAKYVPF